MLGDCMTLKPHQIPDPSSVQDARPQESGEGFPARTLQGPNGRKELRLQVPPGVQN